MQLFLTAAAERAFCEALSWTSDPQSPVLDAPSLLLGLLAEEECRAASMLSSRGIDVAAVCRQWPQYVRCTTRYPAWEHFSPEWTGQTDGGVAVRHLSPEIKSSLAAARRRLAGHPRPLLWATEHLLLGLVAASHDVAQWLRQAGIDPGEVEKEIQVVYGYLSDEPQDATPLEMPPDDEPPIRSSETAASASSLPAAQAEVRPSPAREPAGLEEWMGLYRVMDAAANRAREGLRVVEDYVRFVLDDAHLTRLLKEARHALTSTLGRFSATDRLAARETQADVGTRVTTPTEQHRASVGDVLAANFARLQEALRSLEEFGKVLDAEAAAEFERLRYRTYTLQRAVETTRGSLSRLGHARLYVLLDGRPTMEDFLQLAREVTAAGVDVVQLRDKHLDDRRLLERARALAEIARAAGCLFILNDRPDLAVLAGADGVHVGQEELSVKDARSIVGPRRLVGVSTHSIEQARQAVLDGADYLGAGPTFPSGTKQFESFPGLDYLREVACEIRLPAFAIGGITAENLPQVLQTGIGRVAVSGAVAAAADPVQAVRELRAAWTR
jgi:thiamine-phosphate pyrophosphorylase